MGPVPEETARVATAAFPDGNLYRRMRDEFGPIFTDAAFAPLFAVRGRPAEAPWRLALVTIFQYAEGLSDRQAADAVRSRIDWKYALGLALTDPGFDSTVLCEFRARLVAGQAESQFLDALLDALDAEDAPRWLREVPAVETLRRIWVQQFYRSPEGVRWRTATEGLPPAAKMISSPM